MEEQSNNDALKYAYDMYKREHDRWKDWAIFFIGSISAIFLVWKELKTEVNILIPSILSFILSLLWVFASLSIRATTDAWMATIKEIESDLSKKEVMKIFSAKLEDRTDKFGNWKDLRDTINLFRKKWWEKYLFSVTRLLVCIGLLLFLCFLGLTGFAMAKMLGFTLTDLHIDLQR